MVRVRPREDWKAMSLEKPNWRKLCWTDDKAEYYAGDEEEEVIN